MRRFHIPTPAGLALLGFAVVAGTAQAAPGPALSGLTGVGSLVTRTGDREAAVAGAIVGGAVGALIGSTLPHAAPPPPPRRVIVEEEPEERVIIERPARRVVEIEDDEAPRIVDEEECVTRRTRVYDPDLGETVTRRERRCR